jgi:hypothetical protein
LFAQLTLAVLISRLIALLIGTTFHEYMHNYIGYLMGDNTPVYQGRLTLDPRKHIYWPGFLMFVVLGFGILGTAPINAGTMNNPRVAWGQRLTRLAPGLRLAQCGLQDFAQERLRGSHLNHRHLCCQHHRKTVRHRRQSSERYASSPSRRPLVRLWWHLSRSWP